MQNSIGCPSGPGLQHDTIIVHFPFQIQKLIEDIVNGDDMKGLNSF